ncbi:DUF2306 domain-containing protein [Pseudoxanthomonas sp. NC8]|nr:DUF2306 domain-containing protein [Pseudoxanthomonas sp. NC8]
MLTAVVGQLAFVAFIALFFGGALTDGELAGLNRKPHVTGYVPGDLAGNLQFLGHALLGGLITFAGMLQLVPALRRRWPALHRWNGRLFLCISIMVTASGLFLVWGRGARLGTGSDLSITANAVLIPGVRSAGLAQRVAPRPYPLTAAMPYAPYCWSTACGSCAWASCSPPWRIAPLGVKIDYEGAVFVGVSVASWVLPLAMAQLYFHAERPGRPGMQFFTGGLLLVLPVLTLAGSAAAVAFMWWPVL